MRRSRSFYLRPTDAKPLPSFRPGQFLTIQIDIPGQEWPVIRTYTISDRPSRQYYRLSVKRERIAGQPIGLVSNYLHDSFQIGDILFAKAPTGDFCLDLRGKRPVMLISAGVGITPMICMLSALEGSDIRRPICFIHGSRNGQGHAFASQVRELAAEFENIRVHVAYSRPLPADQPGKDYHSQGRISIETVKALMPGRQAEFYLCGPNAFMREIYDGLVEWGIPVERIHFELFGPSTVMPGKTRTPPTTAPAYRIAFGAGADPILWDGKATPLDAALSRGLKPKYGCRSGVCGTCVCKLVRGKVVQVQTPSASTPSDSILLCSTQPASDIEIDLCDERAGTSLAL